MTSKEWNNIRLTIILNLIVSEVMTSKDWYLVLCIVGTGVCVFTQYKLYLYLKSVWRKDKNL